MRFGARGLLTAAAILAVLAVTASAAVLANEASVAYKAGEAAWSRWTPPRGSTAQIANAIATHVGAQYHVNTTGALLDAVVALPPQIGQVNIKTGKIIMRTGKRIAISEVAICKTPVRDLHIGPLSGTSCRLTIDPTRGAWTYEFCGLGNDCAIASGEGSVTRGRLVRREALEVALYTFKYDPSVRSVVAFMPPPRGQTASTVLYFRVSDYARQLREPLDTTLPLATPPLPTQTDAVEKSTIDKLTLSDLFSYQLVALDKGGAALLLAPLRR